MVSRLLALLAMLSAAPACGDKTNAAGLPALETRLFDCRGEAQPERRTEIPVDCIVDAQCDHRLVTGHRGAGGGMGLYTPENSLAGVRLAILLGVDVVEVDVRHTLDDRLVVMHDSSVERTTTVARDVDEMLVDEVTALSLNADGYPGDFSCEHVPTFEEALALAKGRVNLDVDTKTDRADLVALAIRDADMLTQAFVSSADVAKAELARSAVPDVMLQARPTGTTDYQTHWAALRPEVIEVGETEIAEFVDITETLGSKLFVDVFIQDAIALFEGDTSVYTDIYGQGVNVIQSEYPAWVLDVLGRRYWASLPPHRDLGVDSPLLNP